MERCTLTNVTEIIEKYGTDWSNLILPEGVDFEEVDLSSVLLPDDTELFQKIKDKKIHLATLPWMDFSNWNFDGVDMEFVRFSIYTKLPKDKNLFQKIESKSLLGCILPELDYSIYDFKDVIIYGSEFTKNSKLPKEKDFLKNLKGGVRCCVLPCADYSIYDFKDVCISEAIFTDDSVLPGDTEFFQNIHEYMVDDCVFPIMDFSKYNLKGIDIHSCNIQEHLCSNIDKYDLNQFNEVFLKYLNDRMTTLQANLIKFKYPERIESGNIVLPIRLIESNSNIQEAII